MERLISLLKNSHQAVVLTGAGVSTLSGIRDFRGRNGIYREIDADRIFSIEHFRRDPSFFYSHSKELIYGLGDKEPNIIHQQLARLEELGVISAVITQNIDMLHRKAGSRKIIELHGSPAGHRCLVCSRRCDFPWVRAEVMADRVPHCPECGGLIKPDITFFGELLDVQALREAEELAAGADLMLVLGSSLQVQPAASLPLYTLETGGTLAIVNDGDTPLDAWAEVRLDDLETCFSAIAEDLNAGGLP